VLIRMLFSLINSEISLNNIPITLKLIRHQGILVKWQRTSWRNLAISQLPKFDECNALQNIEDELNNQEGIVSVHDIDLLTKELTTACQAGAFVLQAGDCSEAFHSDKHYVKQQVALIDELSQRILNKLNIPIIKIGRIAGQFAKPRTYKYEKRNGLELPIYRGDMFSDINFTENRRKYQPARILDAYKNSKRIYNYIQKRIYTSHEALFLPYEEALTRKINDKYYDLSAHSLWVGNRTRRINEAHIEFLRGINNPIACKIGPSITPDELIQIVDKLNPNNSSGRIQIITRLGHHKIEKILPDLIIAMKQKGKNILWICDPMHGNTQRVCTNFKTRDFNHILQELKSFFRIFNELNSHPGGIHLEISPEDVTECIGGPDNILPQDLQLRYKTLCDPRLNRNQALHLIESL
jgi:3-deoxy-7-phosphoheptulonate synthase